jgi:iron complex outermembrane receptor protein
VWKGGFLSVNADARVQRSVVDERSGETGARDGDATRRRVGFGVSAELEQFLVQRRLVVVPAVRLDGLENAFAVADGQGEQDDRGVDSFTYAASPRVAARFRIVEGVSLRATGGRYFRPPTLLELFGDRGYAVGNEGLKNEHGTSLDAGMLFDRDVRDFGVYAQAVTFMLRSEDLIQWVQAGPVVRPVNLADAVVWGVETALQVTAPQRVVIAMANYTFTHSVNLDPSSFGFPLPGRPRHQAHVRASVGRELWAQWLGPGPGDSGEGGGGGWIEPRGFARIDALSANFLDPNGRLDVPPRIIVGIGGELHLIRRVDLAVEVRNLFDRKVVAWTPPVGNVSVPLPAPISDFIGYPLPSRSVWANARVRF